MSEIAKDFPLQAFAPTSCKLEVGHLTDFMGLERFE
jgi:hypothetical protein